MNQDELLELIEETYAHVRDKHFSGNTDCSWGAKVMKRELKYRVDPEIENPEDDTNKDAKR